MKGANFVKSLRFRILIILIILGNVPGVFVMQSSLTNFRNRAIEIRKEEVKEQCEIFGNLLIKENYLYDSSSPIVDSKLELFSNVYKGRVLVVDRDFRIIKDTYNADEGRFLVIPEAVRCFRGQNESTFDKKTWALTNISQIKSPDVKQLQGIMVVVVSCTDVKNTLLQMKQKYLLILGLILVMSILLGIVLSGVLVKPFASVTKSIEDVTDGYQNEVILVSDYTETKLITEAFNKMLTRMKILDDSRQEFVSNVSHELKTPMTSMKVLADSLVGQQGMPEELYQEFLTDITAEIDRENEIITDLLSLVKMDKKAADINVKRRSINEALESILKRLRPLAEKRNISLILDSFRPVEADIDELKFTSAIGNLVENGIKYNVDDGWVRVTLDADHNDFYVTVADSGLGIPEDSLERIFERFYRVDKSHSRENISGSGLGLSIARSSIVMHHGTIKVVSKEGEGTTFTVKIPLSYIP